MPHADHARLRPAPLILALVAAVIATLVLVPASPARAASRGAGFGAWQPVSAYGWHGSMLVDGGVLEVAPDLPEARQLAQQLERPGR